MAHDEFEAIKRYINTLLPIETMIGEVKTVDAAAITVSVNGGSPQIAEYPPALQIARGDSVAMMRPRGSAELWKVTNVFTRRNSGFSTAAQPTAAQNPGGKQWSHPSVMYPTGFYDITSTSRDAKLELVKMFNGGIPKIVVSGFAAPTTTAATLILGHSIDDKYRESYRHYMATTNSYSICHEFMGNGALHGEHTFQLWAAVSPGNTIRVNPLLYAVMEI